MTASEPPAIIASASPRRMAFAASPIAWADVAQAVAVAEFGPFAPVWIETRPEHMFTMRPGMKNGLIRRGPFSRTILCVSSMSGSPPIPEPMHTPTRSAFSGVTARPESVIASFAAATAKWMNVSNFLTSFFSRNADGSNPFTSPAMRHA